MITLLLVNFSGKTVFADNEGTGLHVVASEVTFDPMSNVTFANNSDDERWSYNFSWNGIFGI